MDEQLSQHSWLNAGLEQLALHGPDGLRIMTIAEKLGVTKGSFYWHFRDQSEYLAALLAEWECGHTQQIIEAVERTGGDASTKLRNLMSITFAADAGLAQAVRAWATTDSDVGKAVERIDSKRLAYLARLLRALGWPEPDAMTLARWAYCALMGYFSMRGPRFTAQQTELILRTLILKQARAAGLS